MEFINCNPTKQEEQAYKALYSAAERMGANNFQSQYKAHIKKGKSKNTFKFSVTPEHREVVEAMSKILNKEITAEEAMSLLWQYDVKQQRLGL